MNPFFVAAKELLQKKFLVVVNVLILSFSLGAVAIISVVERSIRFGTATAADPFDMVVGTEKDQTKFLLYSVYLQSRDPPPLFDLDKVKNILKSFPEAKIAGHASSDSYEGYKIIGVDQNFFDLSSALSTTTKPALVNENSAVFGARVKLNGDDRIIAHHDDGGHDKQSIHEGFYWHYSARLNQLNSPYDEAIMVPLSSLWKIHGLSGESNLVNAAFIHPKSISDVYQIKSILDKEGFTVIMPGEMLSSFFGLTNQAKDFALYLVYLVQLLVGLGLVVSLVSLFNQQFTAVSIMKAQGAPFLFISLFYFTEALYILLSSFLISLVLIILFSRLILDQIGASIKISLSSNLELGDFEPLILVLSLGTLLSLITSLLSSIKLKSKRLKQ